MTTRHVAFNHDGKPRVGMVTGQGANGVWATDHETGVAHKLPHGSYVDSAPPKPDTASAEAPPKKEPEPEKPPERDWRKDYPGLSRYPPKGAEVQEGKGPGDEKNPWSLAWKEQGKTVRAFSIAYLRGHARQLHDRLHETADHIHGLHDAMAAHLSLLPSSPAAVKAAMVALHEVGVDAPERLKKTQVEVTGDTVMADHHTCRDPKIAGVIRYLLDQPGEVLFRAYGEPVTSEHVTDYLERHLGDGHTAEDLHRYHATRHYSDAAETEKDPHAAGKKAAEAMGHTRPQKRAHFVVHERGKGVNVAAIDKHGGKLLMHGEDRVAAFHEKEHADAYKAKHGGERLPKAEHPDVSPEDVPDHEKVLNRVDPAVLAAHRQGHHANGAAFGAHLHDVRERDPLKFRGGQP